MLGKGGLFAGESAATELSLGSILTNSGRGAGEVYESAKLSRILGAYERQGGTVMQGPEAERLLGSIGTKAAYFPAEGGPGTLIFSSNPTRSEVLEELMHYGQYKSAGFPASGTAAGQAQGIRFEIEAQQRLAAHAERNNWSIEEVNHFRDSEVLWRQLLDSGGR